jgi:hypothetical protein
VALPKKPSFRSLLLVLIAIVLLLALIGIPLETFASGRATSPSTSETTRVSKPTLAELGACNERIPNQPLVPNPVNFKAPDGTKPIGPVTTQPSPGGGSFVVNGQKFVPRGANYERLANTTYDGDHVTCSVSDFDTGPRTSLDSYNPKRATMALSAMAHYGCNVVRVSLNKAEIGNASGPGLDPEYLANLASFINIARYYDIRVMIYISPLPQHYVPSGEVPGGVKSNNNLLYIDPSYLTGEERYVTNLITGLKAANANMSDIFSFELMGEVVFYANAYPLTLSSGSVSTIAGTFDMGSNASRDDMMDENIQDWENGLTNTVRSTEQSLGIPQTMTSVGFFTQNAGDYAKTFRIARPQSSLSSNSLVSFVDFHIYSISHTMASQVNSIGVPANSVTKPLIFGEFGEHTQQAPNAVAAGKDLENWELQSCDIEGFHFSGWIIWTWDDTPSEQPGRYNMTEDDYAIAKGLNSPTHLHAMANCQ